MKLIYTYKYKTILKMINEKSNCRKKNGFGGELKCQAIRRKT